MSRKKRQSKSKKRQLVKLPTREQLLRDQGQIGQRIGKAGERRVIKAFCVPGTPEWVLKSVRPATPEEDAQGVDVFLRTDVGEIPIQVKTSVKNDHETRVEDTNKDIPHVYLTLRESDAEVRQKVYRVAVPKRSSTIQI